MEFFNLTRNNIKNIFDKYNLFTDNSEYCYGEAEKYNEEANTLDKRAEFLESTIAGHNHSETELLLVNSIKRDAAELRSEASSFTKWARAHKALSFIVQLATLCLLPFSIALDLVMLPFKVAAIVFAPVAPLFLSLVVYAAIYLVVFPYIALATLASGIKSLFSKSDNSYQETQGADQLEEEDESVVYNLDVAQEQLVTLAKTQKPLMPCSTLLENTPNLLLCSGFGFLRDVGQKHKEKQEVAATTYTRCKL